MRLSTSRKSLVVGSILTLSVPIFFMLSILLTRAYLLGDQEHYRAFYKSLQYVSITDTYELQTLYLGSSEPLYGLIMWIGANSGLDKDIYISIFNTIFIIYLLKFMIDKNVGILFIILLLSNFYILVLLTAAERLKFSYIALIFAARSRNLRGDIVWAGISILFHFQSIILIFSRIFGKINLFKIKQYYNSNGFWIYTFSIIAISLALYVIFFDSIMLKFRIYSGLGGEISSLGNIALLAIIALLVLPRKMEAALNITACAVAAYVVGPERVNMIAVTLFIYLAARDGQTKNPLTIILMLYFSLKSIDYISMIITYGTGF